MIRSILAEFTLLLLFCPAFGLAQQDPLAHVVVEGGWMRGSVTARFLAGTEEETAADILIACPIPEEPYPAEVLTVGYRHFSKKDVQRALRAIGQSDKGKYTNNREEAYYTRAISEDEAFADISREDAAAQAVAIGLAYFEALGVEIEPDVYTTYRPNDMEDDMAKMSLLYSHKYSDPSVFLERARAQYIRSHRYATDPPYYTCVSFHVMLDGMRLCSPSYPAGYADEPDAWVGLSLCANVRVSDSGVLVGASTSCIPEIKSRRPMTDEDVEAYVDACMLHSGNCEFIAAEDGQTALLAALADSSRMGRLTGSGEDTVFQDERMTEPMTHYGSCGVITGIKPCLFTISKYEWIPVWNIESAAEYADGWRN